MPSGDEYDPGRDERESKTEAVKLLGDVSEDPSLRMARTRLTRTQIISLTMQELQEEVLNPNRQFALLSKQWRFILARNLYALDGRWRDEMQAMFQTQNEVEAAKSVFRE